MNIRNLYYYISLFAIIILFIANPIHAQNTISDAVNYFSNKQYDKAIPIIKSLSEKGNTTAQMLLGSAYQFGLGVEKDDVKAMFYYKSAASLGDANAQAFLAANYYTGDGIAVNYEEAFKWSEKAAKQNHKHGQYFLAECLYYGHGTDKDLIQAAYWYQKSAEQGMANAQYMLGKCYKVGEGVKIDKEKSIYWLSKAADQGNSKAQFDLGFIYYWDSNKDAKEKSFYWFNKAAEKGNKDAYYFLGSLYETGRGVEKDISKAFLYYSKSAKAGDAAACYSVGEFYKKGLGTNQNDIEAFKMFKKAAEKDHWTGELMLSICYYYGIGTSKNLEEATKWYKKAADVDDLGAEATFKATCTEWHLTYKSELAERYANQNMEHKDSPIREEFVVDKAVDENIPQTSIEHSHSFAVIIGNENYQKVSKVECANNDATVFSHYCKKTLGIPEKNVRLYADATYATMLAAIDDIKNIAKVYKGDLNILFYYAGHGIPNESSRDAYLLPIDTDGKNTAVCYPLSKLYQELGSMNANSVIVFMDACFSGAQRGDGMLASARGVAIKAKPAAPQGNMVVFSAASGDETAFPYKEKNHGLFTYFLLKKLQETKGTVTLGELGNYIMDNVTKESVVTNGKSQTPTVMASSSIENNWKNLVIK